ncbi:enoyl-CoA hydratase-related protein [Algirhabdus cladophorae]|uniref:enoyl-CoA hydratase-related protein n=1 Tax=Algirhabdus cladophorae TaxID=3377108 RepID=UPI003B849641
MAFETLNLEVVEGVAYLTLNRPDVRNALSGQMISELHQAADRLEADRSLRCVVLAGAGPMFCAGGDLNWMKAQIKADRPTRILQGLSLAKMLQALNSLTLPVIAKIHGGAFGGGVGLACCCDHVFASDTSKFGLTETKLGLIPATIGPYVAARLGDGAARQIFMSSQVFDAARAQSLGIVSQTVAPDQLHRTVAKQVAAYQNVAPNAARASKALVQSLGPQITEEMIRSTVEKLADTWEGEEALAGIDAFLSKVPPPWAKD